jgi:KDO2-lipid IV(A) lauroyltransferase
MAKRRILRALRHFASGWAIRIALMAWGLLPIFLALRLGRLFGALAHAVDGSGRKRAQTLFAQCLPDVDAQTRRRCVGEMYRQLGQGFAEVACMPRLVRQLQRRTQADWDGIAGQLGPMVESGEGHFLITGHIGAWEILPHLVPRFGGQISSLARATFSNELDVWINARRSLSGGDVIVRPRFEEAPAKTARQLLGALKKGRAIGVLSDQDTDVPSGFAPFFGRMAKTPSIAADLWLRKGHPAVVAALFRQGSGRYRLEARSVEVERTGDDKADRLAYLTEMNRLLEAFIRQAPEQWVWLHRRFKTAPPQSALESDSGEKPRQS